jgi:hypothetical protein
VCIFETTACKIVIIIKFKKINKKGRGCSKMPEGRGGKRGYPPQFDPCVLFVSQKQ